MLQDVLTYPPRRVSMCSVSRQTSGKGYQELRVKSREVTLAKGWMELGPLFFPHGDPLDLELWQVTPPSPNGTSQETLIAHTPFRRGACQLGGSGATITETVLDLVPGDPRVLAALRRKLVSKQLAEAVAVAGSQFVDDWQDARTWEVRLYPTSTSVYAEVFVIWAKSEAMRAEEGAVLPGLDRVGYRFVCESGPDGLRVLPSHGLYGPPPVESQVYAWQSLIEESRAQVEAYLRQ